MTLLLAAALMTASPAQPVEDTGRGRAFIGYLAQGKWSDAEAMLNAKMAEATAGGKLGAVWAQLTAQNGAFRKAERVEVDEVQGYHREVVVCAFERARVGLRVAFDPSGKVAGFFVVPVGDTGQKEEAWAPPPYVDPSHFSSAPVEVGSERLAGALVLPRSTAHFPIVVMVSGSGPTDMDESFGPIKTFRDLAEGLGSRGIASLRFEKRPYRHLPVQTVKEEYLDDAAAAIAQASRVPGVAKVLLLGHSLGATLAPRIAEANPTVAGAILLAGSTWPYPKVLVAQLEYQEKLGFLDEGGKALLTTTRAEAKRMEDPKLQPDARFSGGVTGAYFLDLRGYDALATAGRLKIPMFFGWGERDLKVIPDDWAGWKTQLGSRPNLTYRTYPGLQHLFTPVGTAEVNHVSAGVVADLAAWIGSGSH